MEAIMNLLMGEPVYDDNGNIVRRDFGIKNAVFILVIGYIGYSLISGYNVKSGKRKMKGGLSGGWKVAVGVVGAIFLACVCVGGYLLVPIILKIAMDNITEKI